MVAIIVIAAVAIFCVIDFLFNPTSATWQFLLASAAAIGLARRIPWAGFGYALFQTSYVLGVVIDTALLRGIQRPPVLAVGSLALTLGVAALALFAGRALVRQGHPPGARVPWMVVSAIPILLLTFCSPMVSPTNSMEPTILKGDRILIRRSGPSHIRRGDLIAYRDPSDNRAIFIKRVLALPGESVHLDYKTLYVQGKPVTEPYVAYRANRPDSYRDNFPNGEFPDALKLRVRQEIQSQIKAGEFIVPPNMFFVLGDNRDNSFDSRYEGAIPAANIIGKPMFVYFSSVGNKPLWNRLFKGFGV